MSSRRVKYKTTEDLELSDQIRSWRLQCGLTQSQLEIRAGLSHNAVSRIERNEVSPRVETVEKLATAMDLSIEELTFRQPASVMDATADYISDGVGQLVKRLNGLPRTKREKLMGVMKNLIDLAETE